MLKNRTAKKCIGSEDRLRAVTNDSTIAAAGVDRLCRIYEPDTISADPFVWWCFWVNHAEQFLWRGESGLARLPGVVEVMRVRNSIFAVGLVVAAVSMNVVVPPTFTASATDACALLTPEQVGEAVGAKVGAGTYAAPGFTKTCTWVTKGIIVTLMLEGTDAFQSGKTPPVPSVEVTPVSGVGDDAYYMTVATNVSLFVKKGSSAFKATVYSSTFSVDKKKAMEKTLAQQVVAKL